MRTARWTTLVSAAALLALLPAPVAAKSNDRREAGALQAAEELECEYSVWGNWTECAGAPGTSKGQQTRTRRVLVGNSTHCTLTQDWQECDRIECKGEQCFGPDDCLVTEWTEWSNCSLACGNGTQARSRSIQRPRRRDGKPCPALEEERACNTQHCPIDCSVGEWTEWSNCTRECENGTQWRTRPVAVFPDFGGEECPELRENRTCNTHLCPVDCEVGRWSEWSACSVECNAWGHQNRSREVTVEPVGEGAACPELFEERNCSNGPCPIDCEVSAWGEWSVCSEDCGGGKQARERTIVQKPLFGGRKCPRVMRQERGCNTQPCANECIVSDWAEWSDCSEWCGNGTQTRVREVLRAPRAGFECPALNETRACFMRHCPQDCEVSGWSDWSNCSAVCGTGRQHRRRSVLTPSKHGGTACPTTYQERFCNEGECSVDCMVTAWSEWSACEPHCGPDSRRHRERRIVREADFGGQPCPAPSELREQEACHRPCTKDCEVSEWEAVEECSHPCGGGKQAVRRHVTQRPAHGGAECPPLHAVHKCNTHPCGAALLDTNCSSAVACPACLQRAGCGFSPTAGRCMVGEPSGPTPLFTTSVDYAEDPHQLFINLTNAVDWDWIRCRRHACADYHDFATCVGDARCGWCLADRRCMPGDQRGPSKGLACPAPAYVRWPGYDSRRTARLRKADAIVPTREEALAFAVDDALQRDAVWAQATRAHEAKHPGDTCAPCAGVFPACDCSEIMQRYAAPLA